MSFAGKDVFLNVAGGLRIHEPAADLAVAAALMSSLSNTAFPNDTVVFGEISLSGAVRPVAQTTARLKEASKLGFATALSALPANQDTPPLDVTHIESLGDMIRTLGVLPERTEND